LDAESPRESEPRALLPSEKTNSQSRRALYKASAVVAAGTLWKTPVGKNACRHVGHFGVTVLEIQPPTQLRWKRCLPPHRTSTQSSPSRSKQIAHTSVESAGPSTLRYHCESSWAAATMAEFTAALSGLRGSWGTTAGCSGAAPGGACTPLAATISRATWYVMLPRLFFTKLCRDVAVAGGSPRAAAKAASQS